MMSKRENPENDKENDVYYLKSDVEKQIIADIWHQKHKKEGGNYARTSIK